MNDRVLTQLTLFLGLAVVILGAFVRLSDAGLGCPDWPGCYGHLTVPMTAESVTAANAAYPDRHVEAPKAWKEMAHRYLAGVLGLCVLLIAIRSWRAKEGLAHHRGLTLTLLALVIVQVLLGRWTVTELVKPAIVTAHLLGGMATVGLLWALVLKQSRNAVLPADPRFKPWALIGLTALTVQIALGGWTSTNYAALACTDFPTCQGEWIPPMDLTEGFVIWRGLGVDYEFGVLDHPARVAIHYVHRMGALMVFVVLAGLALSAMRSRFSSLQSTGTWMAVLLLLQIGLGISNVVFSLPLWVAVAHNGVAALLLLSVVSLTVLAFRRT